VFGWIIFRGQFIFTENLKSSMTNILFVQEILKEIEILGTYESNLIT